MSADFSRKDYNAVIRSPEGRFRTLMGSNSCSTMNLVEVALILLYLHLLFMPHYFIGRIS